MISGQTILAPPFVWGWGAEGQTVVFEATGVELNGVPLLRLVASEASGGRWEPVTNGDPENPELVFYDGDVVMYLATD